jgi:hypothetical protein
VVANPVAACLVKSPEDWEWGSHAKVIAGRRAPRWLAHDALEEKLEGITGARCYDRLIETYCRERY